VVTSIPRQLYPRNETRYPLYRKLGGPRGRSGWVQKISPRQGFEPRTVRPIASYCTDWATPVALRKDSRIIKSRPFKCRMNWPFFVMFVTGIIQLGGTSVVYSANSAIFIREIAKTMTASVTLEQNKCHQAECPEMIFGNKSSKNTRFSWSYFCCKRLIKSKINVVR